MTTQLEPDPNCPSCASLANELSALRKVVEKLSGDVERLKARKPKTSRTSSKPPSTDGPWKKHAAKPKPSGKKRGAQPGHKGVQRKPAPPEDVDDTKMVKPEHCGHCSSPLSGDDPNPARHQIIDIPPIKPHITEWELHRLTCSGCGESTKAALPDGVHASNFGPNLCALVVLLSGEYRMSRRRIQRLIADSYGIEISLGAISNMERRVTTALAEPHAEAAASVAQSATKHLDETTWRESGNLAWLWTAVGEEATVFLIRDSRKSDVARELIGDEPSGVLISDRYSGYSFVPIDQRQVCFAHLIRDFRRMAEGQSELRWIGERLLGLSGEVFRLWRLHQSGDIERTTLRRWTKPLRARMLETLDVGARSVGYETPAMCRGILRTEPAMWTFVDLPGIEPTNNVAERAVRPVVIHRKTSLGSQSKRGSEFVASMQTIAATLRQSGASLSEFVGDVARAVLVGSPVPKLLG